MKNILDKIGDASLKEVVDSVPLGDGEQFKAVRKRFPKYDDSFLWLLSYPKEGYRARRKYIEACYEKFHLVLDQNFPKILASEGNFSSRMWELILCDTLSASGTFIPKEAAGADFILETHDKQVIQIEAVAPNESLDEKMRSIKPNYSSGNFFEHGGAIHDLELPIVLRALQGFNQKKFGYRKDLPLIIAINSHKAVGLSSADDYVLRRLFFGLGNVTLTRLENGEYRNGFEQLPNLNKQGKDAFPVAFFRRPEYKHISGIIYTSQSPLGFIPGEHSFSWYNSGITFVPNPIAALPVKTEFPYFKKILCDEEKYQEVDADREFESSISIL